MYIYIVNTWVHECASRYKSLYCDPRVNASSIFLELSSLFSPLLWARVRSRLLRWSDLFFLCSFLHFKGPSTGKCRQTFDYVWQSCVWKLLEASGFGANEWNIKTVLSPDCQYFGGTLPRFQRTNKEFAECCIPFLQLYVNMSQLLLSKRV